MAKAKSTSPRKTAKKEPKKTVSKKGSSKKRPSVETSPQSGMGVFWFFMLALTFFVQGESYLPALIRSISWGSPWGVILSSMQPLWPLVIYLVTVGLVLRRLKEYDGIFVVTTLLLLGLGIGVQMRLGGWSPSGTIALASGCAAYLCILQFGSAERMAVLLPKLRFVAWFFVLFIFGVMVLFGRRYRGGIFLPGNINPSELIKICLVFVAAGWLPRHTEGLKRTLFKVVPFPLLRDGLELAIIWGIPVVGAVVLGDFGLVLILCLTLMLLLMVATRQASWLVFGLAGTVAAGVGVQLVSAHTRARFDVWLHPFLDPLGRGWQVLQGLCAEYAGGLWGTGIGNGMPHLTPIVGSDFVYVALAEEWGLIGCAILLLIYWLWLIHASMAGAHHEDEGVQLLGAGIACVLAVQIILNVGGVTKALPMTGITLPFFSQGGCSLITVLIMSGLLSTISRKKT